MKITDEAKNILKDVMISNQGDCLKATMQKSCCGSSFVLNITKLSKDDVPVFINDIPVLIDDDLKNRADSVTITENNGKLVIQDKSASCC